MLHATCIQVRDGLLWVWGESGPRAFIDSAMTALPVLPEHEKDAAQPFRNWFMRDLPYDYTILCENLVRLWLSITESFRVPMCWP